MVLYIVALSLSGLFFAIEGGKLISLGGSWYFLIAGHSDVLFFAVQYFRSKSSAVVWFILVFLGTLIWALFDAGWDFWPLVSRLMVPTGFMLFGFATRPRCVSAKARAASANCLMPSRSVSRRHAGRLRTNVPAAPDRRLQRGRAAADPG